MTVIDYKGYRIEVCPVGKGWRASIFSPGTTTPWPNSPVNLEKSSIGGDCCRGQAHYRGAPRSTTLIKLCLGENPIPLGVNPFGVPEDNHHSHTGDGFPRCRSARHRPASTRRERAWRGTLPLRNE